MYDALCTCKAAKSLHAGKNNGGKCLGHDSGDKIVTTVMRVDGTQHIEATAAVMVDCPETCERFKYADGERIKERAWAAADEDPNDMMRAVDDNRHRSKKTARARAEGKWGVGPSDHSSCHKAIEFRERPPEGHVPIPVDKSAAYVGILVHDAYTAIRRKRYPWREFGLTVDVPGLDVPGECDEFDPVIGRVTDYKTAGSWKWDKVGDDGPPESDWDQANDYALGLVAAGHTVNELELLYISRDKGLQERFVRPYVEARALAGVGELHAIIEALDAGQPLPRIRAGDELLGPTNNALCARYCPHVVTCWDLDEVPKERSPEGWLLARDDEDGAITNAVGLYAESRSTKTAGDKAQKYARTLLEGVPEGRYGDLTLRWTGGNLSDPKPDPKGRMEVLETEITEAVAADRAPRPVTDLPYPEIRTRSAVSIDVRKVRKATLDKEAKDG